MSVAQRQLVKHLGREARRGQRDIVRELEHAEWEGLGTGRRNRFVGESSLEAHICRNPIIITEEFTTRRETP